MVRGINQGIWNTLQALSDTAKKHPKCLIAAKVTLVTGGLIGFSVGIETGAWSHSAGQIKIYTRGAFVMNVIGCTTLGVIVSPLLVPMTAYEYCKYFVRK